MSRSIAPYLFFSGRCREALEFYEAAVGARIEMVMRFDESPEPIPAGRLPPGHGSRIMHASFRVGENRIMVSDGCDDESRFSGFRLALSVGTEDQARQIFGALAEGGQIDMPLTRTFWSPCYGMVTDRFSVGWMVMVAGDEPGE